MKVRVTITSNGIEKTELHVIPEQVSEGREFFAKLRPLLQEVHERIRHGLPGGTKTGYPKTARGPAAKDWLTPGQAAELLGISKRTLANWRSMGQGPAYRKLGKGSRAPVRYHMADVERFLRGEE